MILHRSQMNGPEWDEFQAQPVVKALAAVETPEQFAEWLTSFPQCALSSVELSLEVSTFTRKPTDPMQWRCSGWLHLETGDYFLWGPSKTLRGAITAALARAEVKR